MKNNFKKISIKNSKRDIFFKTEIKNEELYNFNEREYLSITFDFIFHHEGFETMESIENIEMEINLTNGNIIADLWLENDEELKKEIIRELKGKLKNYNGIRFLLIHI